MVITALQSGISIIPGLTPDAKFRLLTQMDSRLVGQRERNKKDGYFVCRAKWPHRSLSERQHAMRPAFPTILSAYSHNVVHFLQLLQRKAQDRLGAQIFGRKI